MRERNGNPAGRGGETTSIAGFCELTLEMADPEALAAFYTEHLGLEMLQRQEDRIWLAAGPRARLGLWRPGEKEFGDEGGAHVHFAFRADGAVRLAAST